MISIRSDEDERVSPTHDDFSPPPGFRHGHYYRLIRFENKTLVILWTDIRWKILTVAQETALKGFEN